MTAIGASRHFSCVAEFGRYRGIADFGKASAPQIYGLRPNSGQVYGDRQQR